SRAAETDATCGHPHDDEYLWRCGDEPRVRGTQQDRGFGSATRLMDRAADHTSAKWLKIWRREWDSNLGSPTKSAIWEARMAHQASKTSRKQSNSTSYWTLNGR